MMVPWCGNLAIDSGGGEPGGDYSGLLAKLERLSGKLPVLAVTAHADSRRCEEAVSPTVVERIQQQPRSLRFLPSHVLSLDQRLNKAHSLMLFDAFAVSAVCDLPVAEPVQSLTLLSDSQELIQVLAPLIG